MPATPGSTEDSNINVKNMAVSKFKILCPPLPENVSLQNGGASFAIILKEPLSENPLTLQEIREANSTGTFYLSSPGTASCVYRVQMEDREKIFSTDIFSETFSESRFRPYFGLPTQLRTVRGYGQVQGVLYDRRPDLFYIQELGRTNWYLIGRSSNYSGFVVSIAQFSEYLSELWEKEPLAIFEKGLRDLVKSEEKTSASFSPTESQREIDRFLNWLQGFDPALHSHTAKRIRYSPQMKSEEILQRVFCRSDPQEAPYAYLDIEWGEIHFLPPTIALLKKGDYEAAAQVLAHERSHHRVISSGLVIPSHELLQRSIMAFVDREDHSDFWKTFVAPFFRDVFHTAIQCEFLFMTPEEEAQAHAQELFYAQEKLSTPKTRTMKKEALEAIDHLWKHSQEYFPPDWIMLSAQYFAAAQELQRPLMGETKRSAEGIKLFKSDLDYRLACAFGEKEFCQTLSPPFQKLKEMSE